MDEVWDVVVGTKSSVDDLLPKSDELLTQTQRQERAINDIHADLKQKTNKIIANLDVVEKRLKKQEDDVVTLAQRPVAAELLLDPTIDRLVEYDQTRYDQNRYSGKYLSKYLSTMIIAIDTIRLFRSGYLRRIFFRHYLGFD
jgi:hypothetical protein